MVFKNNKPWVEIRPLAERDDFASLPQETKDAIAEIEEMSNDPDHVTYKTADSLFAALDKNCS